MAKKIEERDWDGLLRSHKDIAKNPSGRISLDYHYTLILKVLARHFKALSDSLAEDLYKTLIVGEIGPISVASLKAILRTPKFYAKALPYISDSLYSTFAQAPLPQQEVRAYIKSLSAGKHASESKSVALLMKLLQSQPHPEEWLEEVTLLGQQTGHHEECGRILAQCNWREKAFAKKYLMGLARSDSEAFDQTANTLKADCLASHLVDVLKVHSV